jgi:hypothetical protein
MKRTCQTALSVERLECREVPTVVIVNPTTATYTDVDGDNVTIKVSKGTLRAGLFTTLATGKGDQLQEIDFSGGGFDGASLTISAAKVVGGDGLANVGYINSTGRDLGTVTVKGDLGRIVVGTDNAIVPAVKALAVNSMGQLGTDTQASGGSLESDINGTLGTLSVKHDVAGALVNVTGTNGSIGAITIGGSLIGGSTNNSGEILSLVDMGMVKIGHDVRGGSGQLSGIINCGGTVAGASIGGSLIGGSNTSSGEVFGHVGLGAVRIGHDVQGGSGLASGFILSQGSITSVTIGGSLIGGLNTGSGQIFSGRDLGAVKIGHDLTGGNITGSASLDGAGAILASGRIASVTIGGSIVSGIDNSSGSLTRDATIRAGNDIGSLVVKGSIFGNVTANGASPVIISARGQAVQGKTTDLAFGKISIGGGVQYANILAGYDINLNDLNGDAQIGAVTVGGDWAASNLVAGVKNFDVPANTQFGNIADASIGAGNANISATIASVTIGGQVFGTPNSTNNTDHFGFVAQQVDAVKIGGVAIALKAGAHNDSLDVGETTDVTVHEV